MNGTAIRSVLGLGIAFLVLQPHAALGCAVCFGQSDDDIAKGLVWGIAALLLTIGSVLAGITAFFVQAAKRSAALASPPAVESKPAAELATTTDTQPS